MLCWTCPTNAKVACFVIPHPLPPPKVKKSWGGKLARTVISICLKNKVTTVASELFHQSSLVNSFHIFLVDSKIPYRKNITKLYYVVYKVAAAWPTPLAATPTVEEKRFKTLLPEDSLIADSWVSGGQTLNYFIYFDIQNNWRNTVVDNMSVYYDIIIKYIF